MADPTTKTEALQQANSALLKRIPAVAALAGVTSMTSPSGEAISLDPDALEATLAKQQLVESSLRNQSGGGIAYSRVRLRR